MIPGFYICEDDAIVQQASRPMLEPAIRQNLWALLSAAAYMSEPPTGRADIASASAHAAENADKVTEAVFKRYIYTDKVRQALDDYSRAWGPAAASEFSPELLKESVRSIIFSKANIEYYVSVARALHAAGAPLEQAAQAIYARLVRPLETLKYTINQRLRGIKRERSQVLGDDQLDSLPGDKEVSIVYSGPVIQDPKLYDSVSGQIRDFLRSNPGKNLDTEAIADSVVAEMSEYAMATFPDQYPTESAFHEDVKSYITTHA